MQVKSREGNGNLLQYSCPGNPMDRGGGQSTQYMRLKKVEHSLATKQQQRANTNVLTTEARSLHQLTVLLQLGPQTPKHSISFSASLTSRGSFHHQLGKFDGASFPEG